MGYAFTDLMILVFVLKLRLLYTAEPAESGIARAAQRSEKNLSETTRGRRTQVGGHWDQHRQASRPVRSVSSHWRGVNGRRSQAWWYFTRRRHIQRQWL